MAEYVHEPQVTISEARRVGGMNLQGHLAGTQAHYEAESFSPC
jgi:hypothetical protein